MTIPPRTSPRYETDAGSYRRYALWYFLKHVETLPREQSSAGATPMKATQFLAQNTNNHLFVRPAGLNSKKERASERDSEGPVDEKTNDGVDHVSLYCYLAASFSRGITPHVRAFRSHRGRPKRRRAQSNRSLGRRRRPAVVKKAEDGNAIRIRREERLVAGRQFARGRGNRHPERAHELKLLGGELNGRPDCAHRIDRNAHTLGKRREHFLQRFGLPAAGADVQREAAASATSMRRRIMNGSFGVDGFWSPGSPK